MVGILVFLFVRNIFDGITLFLFVGTIFIIHVDHLQLFVHTVLGQGIEI